MNRNSLKKEKEKKISKIKNKPNNQLIILASEM